MLTFVYGDRHMRGGVLAVVLLAACGGPPAAVVTPSAHSPAPGPSPTPVAISPSPSPPPAQRMEASLPAALEESGAAAAGGKLYVVGGFDAAGNSLRTVWVFDGNAWSAGPRLPLGLDQTSQHTLDDHVYVSRGQRAALLSASLFVLDEPSWS